MGMFGERERERERGREMGTGEGGRERNISKFSNLFPLVSAVNFSQECEP